MIFNSKVIALVAVRLKSKRLKKKSVCSLYGKKVIERLTERLNHSKYLDDIIWCTSINNEDDPIVNLAKLNSVNYFRGSENDIISRFIGAANKFNSKIIIRVTGDNPLTDPSLTDLLIKHHVLNNSDYTYSESFPVGTRSEVMSINTLLKLEKIVKDKDSSEYMTWLLKRPEVFKIFKLNYYIKNSNIKFTIDNLEDLKFLNIIYKKFQGKPPNIKKIISWLNNKPEYFAYQKRNNKELNSPIRSDVDTSFNVNSS